MIYGNLMGGLGNQAFIIATTYAYSLEHGLDCYFSNETNEGLSGVTKRNSYKNSIFKFINRCKKPRLRIYRERNFSYTPLPKMDNVELFGYFQSSKYFDKYKSQIQDLFLKHKDSCNIEMPKGINVSMHFRRTDYTKLQHVHPCQSLEYYNNALNKIEETVGKNYNLIVFSDDINWCKKQKFRKQPIFVDKDDVTELYMMSLCDHNIIANSSFSWWGSYLNKNKNKIVIAPKKWFGPNGPKNWEDIYTENMIKL